MKTSTVWIVETAANATAVGSVAIAATVEEVDGSGVASGTVTVVPVDEEGSIKCMRQQTKAGRTKLSPLSLLKCSSTPKKQTKR